MENSVGALEAVVGVAGPDEVGSAEIAGSAGRVRDGAGHGVTWVAHRRAGGVEWLLMRRLRCLPRG